MAKLNISKEVSLESDKIDTTDVLKSNNQVLLASPVIYFFDKNSYMVYNPIPRTLNFCLNSKDCGYIDENGFHNPNT